MAAAAQGRRDGRHIGPALGAETGLHLPPRLLLDHGGDLHALDGAQHIDDALALVHAGAGLPQQRAGHHGHGRLSAGQKVHPVHRPTFQPHARQAHILIDRLADLVAVQAAVIQRRHDLVAPLRRVAVLKIPRVRCDGRVESLRRLLVDLHAHVQKQLVDQLPGGGGRRLHMVVVANRLRRQVMVDADAAPARGERGGSLGEAIRLPAVQAEGDVRIEPFFQVRRAVSPVQKPQVAGDAVLDENPALLAQPSKAVAQGHRGAQRVPVHIDMRVDADGMRTAEHAGDLRERRLLRRKLLHNAPSSPPPACASRPGSSSGMSSVSRISVIWRP